MNKNSRDNYRDSKDNYLYYQYIYTWNKNSLDIEFKLKSNTLFFWSLT